MLTLGQAIHNAIEMERSAEQFYDTLAQRTPDGEVREFLLEMARQERGHVEAIEQFGQQLDSGKLPQRADANMGGVEISPGWGDPQSTSFEQAIELAIEAENNAALYYDAISDFLDGDGARFFQAMVEIEEQHARRLRQMMERRETAPG